jgi:1-acylglycerol-3-phosphate O-acyltransferase
MRLNMLYTILKAILIPFFHIFFRLEIVGNRRLEDGKPYIIASNHKSNYDPLLVIIALKKRKIHYVGKKELFVHPVLRWILNNTFVISIDRERNDIAGLKKIYKVLKENHILGIFPQGTRVKNDEDDSAKAGIGMFAIRTNTPVIPVSIIAENNYKPFSKVKIVYHDPYYVPSELLEKKNNDSYMLVSNEVMQIIKKEK